MWTRKKIFLLFIAILFGLRFPFASSAVPPNYLISTVSGVGQIYTVAVDPNTNYVYLAGTNMYTNGAISIMAGNHGASSGYADGMGSYATLSSTLWQLVFCSYDSINIIYATDTNNHVIRSITPAGLQ